MKLCTYIVESKPKLLFGLHRYTMPAALTNIHRKRERRGEEGHTCFKYVMNSHCMAMNLFWVGLVSRPLWLLVR